MVLNFRTYLPTDLETEKESSDMVWEYSRERRVNPNPDYILMSLNFSNFTELQ